MWNSILYQINPFHHHISYEDQQKHLLHLIILILIVTICLENITFAFFIFLIIIYLSINKMNTSEHYTQARKKLSPERAAVEYTSVDASNDPTSVTAAQLDILQNTHSTCSTQNSPQILNQLRCMMK